MNWPDPMRSLLVAFALAFALVGTGCGGDEQIASPLPAVVDAVDGTEIDLNDLGGQDSMLWFWAPW